MRKFPSEEFKEIQFLMDRCNELVETHEDIKEEFYALTDEMVERMTIITESICLTFPIGYLINIDGDEFEVISAPTDKKLLTRCNHVVHIRCTKSINGTRLMAPTLIKCWELIPHIPHFEEIKAFIKELQNEHKDAPNDLISRLVNERFSKYLTSNELELIMVRCIATSENESLVDDLALTDE